MDWKSIATRGVTLEKLVSEYTMWHEKLPYTKCKIRVWERSSDFLAISNINVKDYDNNSVDGICGIGKTEPEAVTDLINRLLDMISFYEEKQGRDYHEDDFEYVDNDSF